MLFDHDTAKAIIAHHNLKATTLKVWKTRKKIPDSYKTGVAWSQAQLAKQKDQQVSNLVAALQSGKLHNESVYAMAGIKGYDIKDALQGMGEVQEASLVAIKTAIDRLQIEAGQSYALTNRLIVPEGAIQRLHSFLNRPQISLFRVLDRKVNVYRHVDGWLRGRRNFPTEDIADIRQGLLNFITDTAI